MLGDETSRKDWRNIVEMTGALTKAIMMERRIIGLPTKAVRITDKEAIENIQSMMGYKRSSPARKYLLMKEFIEDPDLSPKLRKYLNLYIKDVERTGGY